MSYLEDKYEDLIRSAVGDWTHGMTHEARLRIAANVIFGEPVGLLTVWTEALVLEVCEDLEHLEEYLEDHSITEVCSALMSLDTVPGTADEIIDAVSDSINTWYKLK